MTLAEVAAEVDGLLHGVDPDTTIDEVVTDSRSASAGGLFIAVVGETHDGHDHVGCGGCRRLRCGGGESRPVAQPHVLVADTAVAAGRLGPGGR